MHGIVYESMPGQSYNSAVGRGDFCSFQKKSSELFEHWDAPIIYRYEHFLLCMTLSMRSLKGGTLSNFGAEYKFF